VGVLSRQPIVPQARTPEVTEYQARSAIKGTTKLNAPRTTGTKRPHGYCSAGPNDSPVTRLREPATKMFPRERGASTMSLSTNCDYADSRPKFIPRFNLRVLHILQPMVLNRLGDSCGRGGGKASRVNSQSHSILVQ
jgi:hypothetical protein